MSLRVAVCTNRPAGAVADCLAALRGQVPDGDLALVASGVDAAEAERHRAPGTRLLWAILDSNQGPRPYQRRALTD